MTNTTIHIEGNLEGVPSGTYDCQMLNYQHYDDDIIRVALELRHIKEGWRMGNFIAALQGIFVGLLVILLLLVMLVAAGRLLSRSVLADEVAVEGQPPERVTVEVKGRRVEVISTVRSRSQEDRRVVKPKEVRIDPVVERDSGVPCYTCGSE